ncbi:hypothetical protein Tco_0673731, partial [Tanacetum coccineum]
VAVSDGLKVVPDGLQRVLNYDAEVDTPKEKDHGTDHERIYSAMEISPGFKRTSIYLIAVGGEAAAKQVLDMDKSAYVRHNMPYHKS